MNGSKRFLIVTGILMLSVAGAVQAEGDAGLQSEVASLKARLAELESKQDQAWLNERRAEEVKGLIREVLSDADTRASLMADGVTAGHNGKSFFLSSDDGSFLMKISGQSQFRFTYNSVDGNAGVGRDKDVGGFSLRRVKLNFSGHVGSPRITYAFGLQYNDSTQNIDLDHAYFGYELMDGVKIYAGQGKAPFLREETTSSKYQLAVERSLVNEFFTAGRVQGVWITSDWDDNTKLAAAITDGVGSGEAAGTPDDFHQDAADFAFTFRADVRLAGEWSQMKDFSAWSGEGQAVFVGAAFHYEVAETGTNVAAGPGTIDEFYTWTIDGSIESEGVGLYAAIVGIHFDNVGAGPTIPEDQYGLLVQGAFMLIPDKFEPFVRWEHFDMDTTHDVNLVTFGANYYLNKHKVKFTTDVVWALNSLANVAPTGNFGLGLLPEISGSNDNQVALRTQFQLLF